MCLFHLLFASLVFSATGADDPAKEARGTLRYIEADSPALEDDDKIDVCVYLPPGYDAADQRYPVVYFLHGMNGSARKWEDRQTHRQVDQLIAAGRLPPVIVVCPDGRNSMYVNWINGRSRWTDFIANDLVATIDAQFRTDTAPRMRAINGDSMGGYGALIVALKNPGVFGSVSAHSAAVYSVDPEQLPDWIKQRGQRWKEIYGYPVDVEFWKANNPLHLAQTLAPEVLESTFLYFDVGQDDRFGYLATNEELHRILAERAVPHHFVARSGDHGADYFERYVEFSLRFHGCVFKGTDPYAADYDEKSLAAVALDEIVQIPENLKIEELIVGTGAEAKNGATVEVHYTGWLTDGTKVDSSKDRDKAVSFPVGRGRVIKGWDLGVLGMKEGGKRKLTIPPELAYGPRGRGDSIAPNATLVYEFELIKVR